MVLKTRKIITILGCLACIDFASGEVAAEISLLSADPVRNTSVCWADDVAYNDQDVVPGAGPCEQCICNVPDVVCSMIKCESKPGCKVIQKPNHCCPDFKCDCEYNGYKYNNGAKIDTSDAPCRVCYCKGGDIMCTTVGCYEREDCEGKIVPGTCCPKYDHCPPLRTDGMKNRVKGPTTNTVTLRNGKHGLQPWLLTTDSTKDTDLMNERFTLSDDEGFVTDSTTLSGKELTMIMRRINNPVDVDVTMEPVPANDQGLSSSTIIAAVKTEIYFAEEDIAVTEDTGFSAAKGALNTIKTSTNVATGGPELFNENITLASLRETISSNVSINSSTRCPSTNPTLVDDIFTAAFINTETTLSLASKDEKANFEVTENHSEVMKSSTTEVPEIGTTENVETESASQLSKAATSQVNTISQLVAGNQLTIRTTVKQVENKSESADDSNLSVAVKLIEKGSNLTAFLLNGVLTDSTTMKTKEDNEELLTAIPKLDSNISSLDILAESSTHERLEYQNLSKVPVSVNESIQKGMNVTSETDIFPVPLSSTPTSLHNSHHISESSILKLASSEVPMHALDNYFPFSGNYSESVEEDQRNGSLFSEEVSKMQSTSNSVQFESSHKFKLMDNGTGNISLIMRSNMTLGNQTDMNTVNDSTEFEKINGLSNNTIHTNASVSKAFELIENASLSNENLSSEIFSNHTDTAIFDNQWGEVVHSTRNTAPTQSVVTSINFNTNPTGVSGIDEIMDLTTVQNVVPETLSMKADEIEIIRKGNQNISSNFSESSASKSSAVSDHHNQFHLSSGNGSYAYNVLTNNEDDEKINLKPAPSSTTRKILFQNNTKEISRLTSITESVRVPTESFSNVSYSLIGAGDVGTSKNGTNRTESLSVLPVSYSTDTPVYSNSTKELYNGSVTESPPLTTVSYADATLSSEFNLAATSVNNSFLVKPASALLDSSTETKSFTTSLQSTRMDHNSSTFSINSDTVTVAINFTEPSSSVIVTERTRLSNSTLSSLYVDRSSTNLNEPILQNTSKIKEVQLNGSTIQESTVSVNDFSELAVPGSVNDSQSTSNINSISSNRTKTGVTYSSSFSHISTNNSDKYLHNETSSLVIELINRNESECAQGLACIPMDEAGNLGNTISNTTPLSSAVNECVLLKKNKTGSDDGCENAELILKESTQKSENISSDLSTPLTDRLEQVNFTEIYAQKFVVHPIKLINSVNSVYLSPGLGFRERPSIFPAFTNSTLLASGSNTPTLSPDRVNETSLFNATSVLKPEDSKSISASWLNASSAVYKILLDGNVKPLTRPPNSTMAPLSWLKGSVIASTDAPDVKNTTKFVDKSPLPSTSQKSRSDANIMSANVDQVDATTSASSIFADVKRTTERNKHNEEPIQAKVYDPLMPYPEEYPEEYQTIQNGPAIIITRTTYTRVPDVTYTTVTMATLPTYQQVQKAEEGLAETMFDRKFHERSYTNRHTDSSTTAEPIDLTKSSYFNIEVKKIKDGVTPQSSKSFKSKKSNHKISTISTLNQSPRKDVSDLPSLDEKDRKIVQNFMNKNLKF